MQRLIRLIFSFILAAGLFGGLLLPTRAAQAQTNSAGVLVLTATGPLSPVMQNYIDRGLVQAQAGHYQAVVIQLNTPGGSVDLMTKIIENILASPVPVIVYVSPAGAMAGSAGTLITLAGSFAAMAPNTAIGAASPIDSSGQNIDSTLETKVKEILKAQARSLTERRGTAAVTLVDSAIDSAKAASAQEARQANLVDFIAADLPDLLTQLDGQTTTVSGQSIVLHTLGTPVVMFDPSLIEGLLNLLTDANLVFLLLTLGIWALLIELSSPGGWVAGFVGAVAILLAVYGLGILPVNWFGLLFLALAFILFIVDIKAPTHGALTVAGAVSLTVGGLVLFNSIRTPGFPGVSVPLVIGVSIFIAASFFVILTIALRAQSIPVLTGRTDLVGLSGEARSEVNPRGVVKLNGEQWSAVLAEGQEPIHKGEKVVVTAMEGLRVWVKRE